MYDTNGDIYKTETLEDCMNAANPNVGDAYQNFCVECLPSFVADLSQTYLIPIRPVILDSPVNFGGMGPPGMGGGGPSVRGIAFNGVRYDAPAPTNVILAAYTLAMIGYAMDGHAIYEYLDANGNPPTNLDECRGQYDDIRGYHYHVDVAGANNFINCLYGAYAN